MSETLTSSDFNFTFQKKIYKGKVRDVYYLKNNIVVMVASDRISAFDVVMPRGIPFKGQILNQIAFKMMNETRELVPNWLIASPDPNVSVGHLCNPFKIEMVIRGYLSGHAAREYKKGERTLCGVKMPDGMKENDKFPEPILGSPEGVIGVFAVSLGGLSPILYTAKISSVAVFLAKLNHCLHPKA